MVCYATVEQNYRRKLPFPFAFFILSAIWTHAWRCSHHLASKKKIHNKGGRGAGCLWSMPTPFFPLRHTASLVQISKDPHETCNKRTGSSSASQAYPFDLFPSLPFLGLFSELTAALPWLTSVIVSFTSQWIHTAQHGSLLSHNISGAKAELRLGSLLLFLYPKSFLYLTDPSFNKHTLKKIFF